MHLHEPLLLEPDLSTAKFTAECGQVAGRTTILVGLPQVWVMTCHRNIKDPTVSAARPQNQAAPGWTRGCEGCEQAAGHEATLAL